MLARRFQKLLCSKRSVSDRSGALSAPAPDIFNVVLKNLKIDGAGAVAIGDTRYDAEAAGKAGVRSIGVLRGGFTEDELRKAGCAEVYPGPAALLACFERSLVCN